MMLKLGDSVRIMNASVHYLSRLAIIVQKGGGRRVKFEKKEETTSGVTHKTLYCGAFFVQISMS